MFLKTNRFLCGCVAVKDFVSGVGSAETAGLKWLLMSQRGMFLALQVAGAAQSPGSSVLVV